MTTVIDILNLREYPHVYHIGDIHGNIKSIVHEITNIKNLENSLIIIHGDIGIGFEKQQYYIDTWKSLIYKLKRYNNRIILFRGNHDDKSYFTKDNILNQLYGNYITLIDDYTILDTIDGAFLCIGGAVSVDRKTRISNKDYWENETVYKLSDEEIDNLISIIKNNNLKLAAICSHNSPRGAYPIDSGIENQGDIIEMYSVYDHQLKEDNYNERNYLRHIQDKLLNDEYINSTLKYWIYGHFHCHYEMNGLLTYICLDMFNKYHNKSDWFSIREDIQKGGGVA